MSNKTIEIIKNRVSCRNYSDKKISLKKALEIAEAGKFAPSGMNRQIANIYLINSKRYVEKLRTLSIKTLGRDCMYGAKTIILVGGPREDCFTPQDCSCVLENMFVAANALKIASCWINQFDELFQNKDGLKVKKSLGIPEDIRIIGSCILGYPKDGAFPEPKARKEDFIKVL
ncbi:MAG: nitroreductase family protein [Bacilli bacterium]|nr:nitroreductase family protein [Bacilli bacterium]